MTTSALSLEALIDLIQPDLQAIVDGRRRMHDVWHNRPTDSLPIIFSAPAPEGAVGSSDMRRHVLEKEWMLYDAAMGLAGAARAGSDGQLTIRANTGTGSLATVAGCDSIPSEFGLPWTTHITREQIEAFDPAESIAEKGVMPRVRELHDYFRAMLPDCVQLFCADTQSPFDLAHLLYGDELFYAICDEPDFVHALLEKTTALYIEGTRLMKEWIGEPLNGGYHIGMALANGGVRACEDTSTLLSGEDIARFVIPYQQRALEAFGGGFVHFCGTNPALYAAEIANPAVRGLNLGNPERYDFGVVLLQLIEAGKCYAGSIPRQPDESLDDYFRRVIGYTAGTRKGLIFNADIHPEEANEPQRVLDLWRTLQ